MKEKDEKPGTLHSGHRKRVRDRFRKEGLDAFAPHEVLELILFHGHARADVNPLAHRLIEHFGSLRGVLEAEYSQLKQVKGVGDETATLLSLMVPVFRKYAASMVEEQKIILNRMDAIRYCMALQAGRRNENLIAIGINSNNEVLGYRIVAEGSLTEVQAYPRVLVEVALDFNARGLILCHNHPGGSVTPSQADIEATKQLEKVLNALDIELLDHIIVAGEMTYSMLCHGIIRTEDEKVGKPALQKDTETGLLAGMIKER